LAISRAKKLFSVDHVNVQPYSGSPANLAVYSAVLKPGEKLLGMSLAHGGHLTHGHKVSASGKIYDAVQYGVSEKDELLDYDEIRRIAIKEKPKIIVSGATAYPRKIDFKRFHEIAQEIGAYSMADISHIAGLIIGGVHDSPCGFTDFITTTTHKTLRGPRGAIIMCKKEFADIVDKGVFPGLQGGPHDHQIAAKAVCFHEAMRPEFKDYAEQIVKNSKAMAKVLIGDGIRLVTGGSDNHLILIDLSRNNITGKVAEGVLEDVGITVNKNMIPFDKRSPFDPSGIRIGTPALTTRGMKEKEMGEIGYMISRTVKNLRDDGVKNEVKKNVARLCGEFPIYGS
jgi:glycine hydroxymethyltransferase